jgi:hypothetical protein
MTRGAVTFPVTMVPPRDRDAVFVRWETRDRFSRLTLSKWHRIGRAFPGGGSFTRCGLYVPVSVSERLPLDAAPRGFAAVACRRKGCRG